MWDGLMTDYFNHAFDGFLFKNFPGFYEFHKIFLKWINNWDKMASVFAFEFFKQLSFDVIVMLVDFVDSFLSIFLDDLSILLEA